MVSIADYQATGRCFVPLALNDRFPAILNAQNPAIPSAHPQHENLSKKNNKMTDSSMKVVKENLGAPVVRPAFGFSGKFM